MVEKSDTQYVPLCSVVSNLNVEFNWELFINTQLLNSIPEMVRRIPQYRLHDWYPHQAIYRGLKLEDSIEFKYWF